MAGDSTYCFSGTGDFVIENGILKGREEPYIAEHSSYGELLLDRLKADPKFVGQINGVTGEEETFEQMMMKSVKCAMWLKKQNVQPGDVVAVCSGICMDAYVPVLSSLYVGAVFNAWWDSGVTKDVARHFFKLTEPKILFADVTSAGMAQEVAQEMGVDVKIVVFEKLPGFQSLEEILATQDDNLVSEFRCTKLPSLDAPAVLVYTSGTTGMPKGALHSHRSLFGNLNLISKLGTTTGTKVVTMLLFSPLSWVTGLLCLLRGVAAHQRKIVYPEFDEETTLKLIEKFKVDWLFVGTSPAVRLVKCEALGKYDISSLEFVFSGGAALKADTQKALSNAFPHAIIFQAYGGGYGFSIPGALVIFTIASGASEMGGVIAQQSANYKPGSCGRIVKNVSMKIVDPETNRILGPNETGEACLKSPFMMTHYYKNPEATSKAVDSEGWYHTGDLVHYDEEGHIFITDRMKEMIKYRGHHVSPAMVEQVLQNHPGVSEAAVLGLPYEIDDEHPIAFVAKTKTSNVTKEELMQLVADSLPDYMRLRGGVMFLDELPHTSSGKVARTDLRNLARSYGSP